MNTQTAISLQEQKDYILSHFDFKKVRKAMTALNWRWNIEGIGMTVPYISDLKSKAEELLQRLEDDNEAKAISSGGLYASLYDGYFGLSFILEETAGQDI